MLASRGLGRLATLAALAAMTGLVAVAGPAAAGPAAADPATVHQIRFAGRLATASWTTCPAPQAGLVCTDTVVIASDSALREDKERSAGPRVVLQRFVYTVVDFGGGTFGHRPIMESFGGTGDATVAIRPRLETATASATVPMNTCTYDADLNSTCGPDTATVSVTWAGVGALQRIDERSVLPGAGFLAKSYTLGWQRSATATGALDGGAIPGGTDPNFPPGLVTAEQGEVFVCHGAC